MEGVHFAAEIERPGDDAERIPPPNGTAGRSCAPAPGLPVEIPGQLQQLARQVGAERDLQHPGHG
jgi:hypothetical protein